MVDTYLWFSFRIEKFKSDIFSEKVCFEVALHLNREGKLIKPTEERIRNGNPRKN